MRKAGVVLPQKFFIVGLYYLKKHEAGVLHQPDEEQLGQLLESQTKGTTATKREMWR